MAKVGDLIRGSEFIKADGFDELKPEVTISLPTYKRGDNGLFKACVESLLKQTFTNFELIIIDDASTDSTFSQIQEFMRKDSRIAVIRHKQNIGLPAISQYEAYFHSRSDKFFYAYDDCEFNPDAIKALYNYMINNSDVKFVYGAAEIKQPEKNVILGEKKFGYYNLKSFNCIPKSIVLMDKEVVETIGYYDPHVSMIRTCDWDLWLRVVSEFKIHNILKVLVFDKGYLEDDSIRCSYPVFTDLIKEWIKDSDRNKKLLPENILDYEIDNKPPDLSKYSKELIDKTLKEKFSTYFWYTSVSDEYKDSKFIFALIAANIASTGIILDTLSKEVKDNLVVKTFTEFNESLHDNFSKAKALLFTRGINITSWAYAQLCNTYNIPYYYYTDDNFFELGFIEKSEDNFNFIKSAKGCLLSSDSLINYFKEYNLNDNFYFVVPAISKQQKKYLKINLDKYKNPRQLNFLYASNHRFDGVLKLTDIFVKLAKEYAVKFFIFTNGEQFDEMRIFSRICAQNNIEIEFLATCHDHGLFIKKIAELNIHFILHPQSFNNELFKSNHKNKTLNFLINAYLSSSIIFASNLEPFSKLKSEGILSNLIYDNPNEIYDKIKEILNNYQYAKELFGALEDYCLKNFDPKINEQVFLDILEELEPHTV